MRDRIICPGYLWNGLTDSADKGRGILLRGEKILKLGTKAELLALSPSAEVREDPDWFILPAFTDAHDHGRGITPSSMSVPDQALELWLQDLNKLAAIPHYEACYYDGVRMAASGVAMVLHSHNPNSFSGMCQELVDAAHGYRDAGLKSILCPLYIDQNKKIYYNRKEFIEALPEPFRGSFAAGIRDQLMSLSEYFALIEETAARLKDDIAEGWTELQLHPNGGQWCSDEALLAMKDYALSHGMHIHLHLLETQYQAEYAHRTWGKSFIRHYDEIGFLGPWVSFGHAVWLDEEDLELIRRSGAILVNNASSNLRLRSGAFPMKKAEAKGLTIGIGMDGCTLDDDQDFLREMRVAWLNNRETGVDAAVDPLYVLKAGTSSGARVSARKLTAGVLSEGKPADLCCISLAKLFYPFSDPDSDPIAMTIQRGTRSCVQFTLVNGRTSFEAGEEFRKKEEAAAERIAACLKTLREKDPGKRDNTLLLKAVHDFYTDGGLGNASETRSHYLNPSQENT